MSLEQVNVDVLINGSCCVCDKSSRRRICNTNKLVGRAMGRVEVGLRLC